MKTFACLVVASVVGVLRADPTDDAFAAMMKLSSAPNYSWTSEITQNGHALGIQGKTTDNGYSLLTFTGYASPPSPSTGTPGSSTSSSGGTNAVFQGDSKYVVQTAAGWSVPTRATPANDTGEESSASSGRTGRSGGRGGMRSGGGMRGGRSGSGRSGGTSGQRSRSTTEDTGGNPPLPSAINLPHEELAIVAANYTNLHLEDGVLVGNLTQAGADLLLVPTGSTEHPPEGSAGTFRLWIKDGAVTKYELKLTAKTGPGGARMSGGWSETITVDLQNVGATTVDVPEAAKRRLAT